MKRTFLFFFLLYFSILKAGTPFLDSVQTVLKRIPDDTAKVGRIIRFSELAFKKDFEDGSEAVVISLLDQSIALASKLNYEQGLVDAEFHKGNYLVTYGKINEAR